MDTRLHALVGAQQGIVTAAQASRVGVTDAELLRATRSGELVRARRGAYISGTIWRLADDDERFRLRVAAIALSRPDDVLSHHAALAVHRLPLWGHDPARVDLLTATRRASSRNGLHVHPEAGVPVVTTSGVRTVSVARALVRTGLTMGPACAVVAGDAALRRGLVTVEELIAEVALLSPHEGRARAMEIVARMNGRAESPGESRTRLIVHDLGFEYEIQVEICDDSHRLVGRVDLLVEGVVVEFDGRMKYRADQADPDDPEAVARIVWAEKRREDDIRSLGHPVERIVWHELDRPALIGVRLRAARARVPSDLARPA